MEFFVMTPLIIGQLIDNLAGEDPAPIVAAGLSMILNDEIRCKIYNDPLNRKVCVLYVYGNLLEQAESIAKLALSIPTCDEDGSGYVKGTRQFERCEVYALAADVFVERSS